MKVVDIYLASSRLGKYPPLFTSPSVASVLTVTPEHSDKFKSCKFLHCAENKMSNYIYIYFCCKQNIKHTSWYFKTFSLQFYFNNTSNKLNKITIFRYIRENLNHTYTCSSLQKAQMWQWWNTSYDWTSNLGVTHSELSEPSCDWLNGIKECSAVLNSRLKGTQSVLGPCWPGH